MNWHMNTIRTLADRHPEKTDSSITTDNIIIDRDEG
jgi:hypothetical protein